MWKGEKMTIFKNDYITAARENVAKYQMVGEEVIVDLQHLLAVMIGHSATPELCGRLSSYGLKGLTELSIQEMKSEGLTDVQALRLFSSFTLANKMKNNFISDEPYTIRSPEDAADFMMDEMRHLNQENLVVLYLNTKNHVIHKKTVFIGSLNASVVHPREVYKEALKQSAASSIVLHNHPSGDPLNIVS